MSLTRPLTRPLTRALNASDITSFKYGGVFNPLSLNPYAFFDGESYKGTLENPTLDLDPATPSTLDVITATRSGTTATYTDSSGLIQTASADTVRVDYTQGEQLTPTKYQNIGYTDFSSGWTGIRTQTQQATGHLGFPSQLITRINESSGSAGTYYLSVSSLTDGQTYRYSLYIRRITGTSDITLRHRYAVEGSDSLVSVTQDWQRFEVSTTKAVGSDIQFGITIADFGDQIEIAMPQVEEGTTASDFVANTTGSPKFITGATYGPRVPMILVEPAATNLARNTDFSQNWNTLSASTAAGGGYAGQTSVIVTATGSSGRYRQGLSGESAGVTYTASIWIRRVSGSGSIRFEHNSSPTGNTSSPLNITEEWSRVEAQFEGECFAWGIQIDTSGDSVEIAMPQVEEGSVATSFIPAGGAGATRAADELEITGSDFSNFYNTSEGTVYVEYEPKVISSTSTVFSFQDGNLDNNNFIRSLASTAYNFWVINGGGEQAQFSIAGATSNSLNRFAGSYKASEHKASLNGVDGTSTTNGTVPSVTQLLIGRQPLYGGRNLNGHIKRLIYWPYHSDNL